MHFCFAVMQKAVNDRFSRTETRTAHQQLGPIMRYVCSCHSTKSLRAGDSKLRKASESSGPVCCKNALYCIQLKTALGCRDQSYQQVRNCEMQNEIAKQTSEAAASAKPRSIRLSKQKSVLTDPTS